MERHREYTKEQAQTQQALQKVEYNRQLAEALRFREELAARAGEHLSMQQYHLDVVSGFLSLHHSFGSVFELHGFYVAAIFAGIQASQAAAQPVGNHQAPPAPRTSAAPVPPNLSRSTTNTVSGTPGQPDRLQVHEFSL